MNTTKNPLCCGLSEDRIADTCSIVIFGASGDLTRRKLMPALYNLAVEQLLPFRFAVVGVARKEKELSLFRDEMKEGISLFSRRKIEDETLWSDFEQGISYVQGSFNQKETYTRLKEHLEQVDRRRGTEGNRLFYLAVPPSELMSIVVQLREAGLVHPCGFSNGGMPWARVVFEKPFGYDLASAHRLNEIITTAFKEDQVYRIDHYLGKETVQNLLVFRFANSLFEPLWNSQHVDHVQITVAEDIGIEGRGKFYEETGIIRDVVQNHLLQLLCLTAMEPPLSLAPDAVRDEKVKVLRSLQPIERSQVPLAIVRGQYGRGFVRGDEVIAYREEKDVSSNSRVETFIAMKVWINNWRWSGVPFYIRAGKRLARRTTEIAIQFKKVPHTLFRAPDGGIAPNVLSMRIQPDEGIALRFISKEPGQHTILRDVAMDFRYGTAFGSNTPEAYERLLLDAMRGEATLFTRRDEVEEQWAYINQILDAWMHEADAPPPIYPSGTWGPEASHDLIARDGRRWRCP
ncbi:glucose-6-phosphate dehydrogenase [Pajaroellobacter abortibovis]|uniref:Glucose-6-phosphate 1-dehydrogenase n=1 Tax=Pajaroellobacter abortibovis TaxID=1882918 RepID=A0A1L6MXA1_9BACT|nr:glucose-6-phosphate dehydrogenase [Pajaroellobacter abortibovis]APS00079.1 glucose-6-phosphate dehydrogenase [Pajaroellobacter abortibovis]